MTNQNLKLLKNLKKNILLKNYTTFRIGGPAKYFCEVKTTNGLKMAIEFAKANKLPFFILGAGSNLLVPDKGYNGLAIKLQITNYKLQDNKIYADAGIKLADLVSFSLKKGLTGLEWAAGIPGTLGGAIYQNAGAFEGEISKISKKVKILETSGGRGKIKILSPSDCQFGYRKSIFMKKPNWIILSAELCLKKGERKEIFKKIKENVNYREKRHPLNFPSAGCIFKNFKSDSCDSKTRREKRTWFSSNAGARGKEIPAAYLIDKCDLKGKRIGEAKISEKHPNFIVNLGKASFKDVLNLIKLIKQKVKRKFKINLKEEIKILS